MGLCLQKGFINITDGKNFVKAAQKSDDSFQIKKVISQAEGIWKYNDGNDDSRDNGSSQCIPQGGRQHRVVRCSKRRHNRSARPDQVLISI